MRQRRSIRLAGHDYSGPSTYFLTLVAHGGIEFFGKIVDAKMELNEFGLIVHREWLRSAQLRPELRLDVFQIMPNHFHALVHFVDDGRRASVEAAPARRVDADIRAAAKGKIVAETRKARSLGSLVAGFKSAVTSQINTLRGEPGTPVWQRNYYERIVRDRSELNATRRYIKANPRNWANDEEHPLMIAARQRTGEATSGSRAQRTSP